MGSAREEPGHSRSDSPPHDVKIDAFALGRTEVTFAQWDACVTDGGCKRTPRDRWGRGDQPVIHVSHADALEYTAWLTRKTGAPYRLPTEAEWEYAARAGTTSPFSFGEQISSAQASYDASLPYGSGTSGEFRGKTVAAGSLPANAWGLHEMHGNVWEWTDDHWNDSYLFAPNDGSARQDGIDSIRVIRGGSWNCLPSNVRSASRFSHPVADFYSGDLGFRVARDLR